MNLKRLYWAAPLLAALTTGAHGATISWTNLNGGNWSAPLNWGSHVLPGSFDTASISASGTYTVTVDTNVTIFALALGGASGQQTLTNGLWTMTFTNGQVSANGVFDLGGSGDLSGAVLTNSGTMNLSGGIVGAGLNVTPTGIVQVNGGAVTLEATLTNSGSVYWTGASSSMTVINKPGSYTGAIYNQPGALFSIQNDLTLYCGCYGFEFFVNAGTLRKTTATGVTSINVPFTNNGTVDAESGTIQFVGNGNIGGTYNTASNATIQFAGGSYVETGTVTNTGLGLFRQNGATVTLNDRIPNFFLVSGNVVLSPTFQGIGAIENLQLDGASLTGTNRVTGTLGINGGILPAGSPLTVAASGVLDFNGASVTVAAPLTNQGTINWSGSTLEIANNGSAYNGAIFNEAGALFNIQTDQNCDTEGFGFEFFSNAGTVSKSAGLGVTEFYVSFTNAGTVEAESGTIQFNYRGNVGGTYNTASGASIQFTSGTYAQSGAPAITGSGVCELNGATVTLNDQIPNFVLASGNVALSPTFQTNGAIHNLQLSGALLTGTNVVVGTLGLGGGGLAQASPLTVASNGVLNFNGAGVVIYAPLTNAGTINWSSGALQLANNTNTYTGLIRNQPGGLFLLESDLGLNTAGFGLEYFNNAGTVRKIAGVGVSTLDVLFTNSGTIDAESGTIEFMAGGLIGGTYNTASGAEIEFESGNYLVPGPVTVTGTGLCQQYGANVTLSDRIPNLLLASGNVALTPNFQTNGTIENLQLDGAMLTGTNRVTGTLGLGGGGLAEASPLTVTASGVLDFNGATVVIYSPLTNQGTINWSSGGLSLANNTNAYTGVIQNQSGANFNIQCDQTFSSSGFGFESFTSAGTLTKTAGLGTTSIDLPFTNSGTLNAQSGTISFGSLYTQTGGTMNFGIASLDYFGRLAFTNAPFTGTLSVNFNDGYFPNAGDSFALVSYISHTGVYTNLALPIQAQWQTNYSSTTFTLSVLSASGIQPVTVTPVSFAAGKFTLQLNGSIGPTYVVQASSNLSSWAAIATNVPSTMPLTIIDTNAGKFSHRFYRILVEP
jgi:hypothetical protein